MSAHSMTIQNNPDWVKDCMHWRGRVLTGAKAHWCYDWDGLPVDETTPEELNCCNCFYDGDEA